MRVFDILVHSHQHFISSYGFPRLFNVMTGTYFVRTMMDPVRSKCLEIFRWECGRVCVGSRRAVRYSYALLCCAHPKSEGAVLECAGRGARVESRQT